MTKADKNTGDLGFDLGNLKERMLNDAWVTINHPETGAPTPIKIKVAGPDSRVYRDVADRVSNQNIRALSKPGKRASAEYLDIQDVRRGQLEILVAATLEWEGVTWGGTPLECTPENISTMYTEFPFIREQVDQFIGDRTNFFRK